MVYEDKEKQKAAWRRWYHNNAEYRSRQICLRRKRRERARKFVLDYKRNKERAICPENHLACLEFHHVNGKKESNISDCVRMGWV